MSQTRLDEGHRRWGRSLGLAGRCIGLPEFSCGQHRHWRALRLLNDRVARSIGAATPPSNAGSIFAQPESAPPPRVQFGRSLNIATQPAATSRADGRLLSRPQSALSLKRAMGSSTESLTQRWLRQNIQPYAQKDTVYSHVDAVLSRFPSVRPKTDIYSSVMPSPVRSPELMLRLSLQPTMTAGHSYYCVYTVCCPFPTVARRTTSRSQSGLQENIRACLRSRMSSPRAICSSAPASSWRLAVAVR